MDIDIDFKTTFKPKDIFPNIIVASRVFDGKLLKHPAGVYFQTVPVDSVTQLSAIPFKEAESYGCIKIDMLHLSILDNFNSKDEIRQILKSPINWDLLKIPSVVVKLFQLGKHFDLVSAIKPSSILELADCISLIRPAKIELQQEYISSPHREYVRMKIYSKPNGRGMWFKKAHAVAYAHTVILQMHLIQEGTI